MRKLTKSILVSVLAVSAILLTMSPTNAYTIYDSYVGGTPNNTSWYGKDLIGENSLFQVNKMEVPHSGSALVVDIYTTYLNNIGQYQTQLGDLFISTDGWKPFGSAPYKDDTMANGEKWEYALVMDNHLPSISTGQNSGNVYLYGITSTSQIEASSAPSGYVYRAGQEVQLNTTSLTSIATGTWSIGNLGTASDEDDYLRFAINFGFGPISELGFHWTMSCGNDVIEGSAPVPEPAIMLLLGTGLIGLAGFGRKRLLKK
jgi:hypothetical protein